MSNEDITLASEIKNYLNTNPFASTLGASRHFKLTRTEFRHFCSRTGIKLPKAISRRIRATLTRKQCNPFQHWSIN